MLKPLFSKYVIALIGTLLIVACSGGGGSSDGDGDSLVPDGTGSGVPADNVSTDELQRNAANYAARAIGLKTDEITGIIGDANQADSTGTTDDINIPQGSVSDNLNSNTDGIINSTLGVGTESTSTVTREGNIITIDPDDASICDAEAAADEDIELNGCLAIVQNITVQIHALSEDTGVITYFYKNEPLLLIGYSPTTGSYEVKLATFRTFSIDVNANKPGDTQVEFPETLSGAIRLSVAALDGVEGEAGSMSLQVTESVVIADSNQGIDLSLAPSTVLSLITDAGTGDGSIEFNLAALQATVPDEDQNIGQVILPGFSGRADITNNGGTLTVSNLGLARGPLTITVNSGEAVRLALETFGFSVTEQNGEIILDGNLALSAFLNNTMGIDEDRLASYQAMLEIAAPSGTTFLGQSNGSTKIERGGPFTISLSESDELSSIEASFMGTAGSCFTSAENDSTEIFDLVACDP